MVIKAKENSLGAWAFLIGIILAIIIGLSGTIFGIHFFQRYSAQIYGLLVLLGLIVGFMNKDVTDSMHFLYIGAILVIISRFGMDSVTGSLIGIGIGDAVRSIFAAILSLFVPAIIIVALKKIFSMAKI